ncbi:uncharacterized protein LOC134739552 [Pongo pygmaeus]|uniref:uncharacterized protein LOC134739552 n=1 Tax=Pongo pygmaeus TaxID=9600 RepID=UPI00300D53E9
MNEARAKPDKVLRLREPQHPTRGRPAARRGPRRRDLPGGACKPRRSHSRRRLARQLDEGDGWRTRAPRCRREAAPVATAATRKWRRGLARASRGLEEPRPRGPARRHTARSRDSPSRFPSSESRYGVVKGKYRRSTGSLRRLLTDACRGPRGSSPGELEEDSRDTVVTEAPDWRLQRQQRHTTDRQGDPSRRPSRRTGSGRRRVTACDPWRKRNSPDLAWGRTHTNCSKAWRGSSKANGLLPARGPGRRRELWLPAVGRPGCSVPGHCCGAFSFPHLWQSKPRGGTRQSC